MLAFLQVMFGHMFFCPGDISEMSLGTQEFTSHSQIVMFQVWADVKEVRNVQTIYGYYKISLNIPNYLWTFQSMDLPNFPQLFVRFNLTSAPSEWWDSLLPLVRDQTCAESVRTTWKSDCQLVWNSWFVSVLTNNCTYCINGDYFNISRVRVREHRWSCSR